MIITIAGTYGSVGLAIGQRAAEITGYRFLDDETAEKMLKEMNIDLDPGDFRYFDENQGMDTMANLHRVSAVMNSGTIRHYFDDAEPRLPLEARLKDAVKKIAVEFAKDGDCIMVGRCAGYFLKPNDDLICIFTVDDEDNCIQRTCDYFGCNEAEAKKRIRQGNKRRAEYAKLFTDSDKWGSVDHYDYFIRTSTLGIEGSAQLIKSLIDIRKSQKEKAD